MNLDDLGQPLDASDVEGDPHDRPVVRDGAITSAGGWCAPKEVVEQAAASVDRFLAEQARHAGLGLPCDVCGPRCTIDDEPDDEPDPALGEVVDENFDLGNQPAGLLVDERGDIDPAEMRELTERFREAVGKPGTWVVPPPLPAAPADAAFVLYLAGCTQCAQSGTNLGDGDPRHMAVPFASEADRDKWAQTHATVRRHRVALVEQSPSTGSTITGYAEPGPGPDRPVRAAVPYEPPLIAFVVRSGQQPDLICTIPERAAAAWLLTAAHATLLGRGSLGIPQPHRALYVGRITRKPAPGDAVPEVTIRIDGLLGATDRRFSRPIGSTMDVAAKLSPDQVEDVCEALISRVHQLPRNLFSVVIMADAPTAEPPDALAEAVLRAERLVRRDQHTGTKVDALAEFVDREPLVEHRHGAHGWHRHTATEYREHQQPIDGEEIFPGSGPAAEVAETAPDR